MIADLADRVALVTGGGQGVGRAIALVLAEQGASVAIGDVRLDLATAVVHEIEQIGRKALAVQLDVRTPESVSQALESILGRWGQLDILVNNAGVAQASPGPDGTVDPDAEWRLVIDVNLRGVINCCEAILPHMAARRYGKVINIASTAGKPGDPLPPSTAPTDSSDVSRVLPGRSGYPLSKAGVIRYTHLLAGSAACFNINVNCVCPSRMVTAMGLGLAARAQQRSGATETDVLEQRRSDARQVNRFGRELEPVDVAKMVAFLASDDARNITGQSINVDGGFKMA